jgi:hypothetical protein
MSDYSKLYFSNDLKHPPNDGELDETNSPYLLASYHIPILWIALFEVSDAKKIIKASDEEWDYYCKPPKSAADLLNSRKELILSLFPNLKREWLEQFQSFISNANFKYVHLDIYQIGGTTFQEPDLWNKEFQQMIGIFDQANILQEPNIFTSPKLYVDEKESKATSQNLIAKFFSMFKKDSEPEKDKTIRTGWVMYQMRFRTYLTDDKYKNYSWVYCGGSGTDELQSWEQT